MTGVPYLSHALVFLHWHKLVVHAVDEQNRHGELSVVDLVALGPVLAAHHGPKHKGRHIECIALLQQLLFFGPLAGEAGPGGGGQGGEHHWSPQAISATSGAPHASPSHTASPPIHLGEMLGQGRATHLRKLHARQGDKQCRTHVGMLKMEQKLGSRAVGPPPLIMITLCTRSGYSCARNVQKETLPGGRWWGGSKGSGQQDASSERMNALPSPRGRSLKAKILPMGSMSTKSG